MDIVTSFPETARLVDRYGRVRGLLRVAFSF